MLAGCGLTSSEEVEETPTPANTDRNTPGEEDPDDDRIYQQCDVLVLAYDRLPPEVRQEIDAALEDGQYRTQGRLHLADALDVERSYLSVDETYYRPLVSRNEEVTAFSLEETVPNVDGHAPLKVENRSDLAVAVRLTATDEDGNVVVDEEQRLEPGVQSRYGVLTRFGTYELRARADSDILERFDISIDETAREVLVAVDDDEITYSQVVADQAPCPWEDDSQE
jgi:hypothetical protein